jgi:hypothetical protein
MRPKGEYIENKNTSESRTFPKWCEDLGLECQGKFPDEETIMTYDEFCVVPDVRLIKVRRTALYGFWRKGVTARYSGESRTVQEWLDDVGLEIVDPTQNELNDLNLFLNWDDFVNWSSGIVTDKENTSNLNWFARLNNKLFSQ